jgi:hypothetical protein
MLVKLGDLVQIKIPTERSDQNDIWVVIGWNNFNDYIRVKNIRNGYTCQYNMAYLKHFKSDKN